MTNDGEFSNMLTHPKHKIDKVYVAKVKGVVLIMILLSHCEKVSLLMGEKQHQLSLKFYQ